MDSAYDFCEKMQNKTSNKTHMHKKCKTQVVHLKINPVFDTVKIITIYPSKQIFKGTCFLSLINIFLILFCQLKEEFD